MAQFDTVIVGAGIAGLSLAWHLTQAGQKVCIVERNPRALGASVRNFGMIWPVGQPNPETESLALRSAEFWTKLAPEVGFWLDPRGSLCLAYHPLELQVMQEYLDQVPDQRGRKLLTAAEVKEKCPQVREENLVGGLWSPTEIAVDAREVAPLFSAYLQKLGVEIRYGQTISESGTGYVSVTGQGRITGDSIALCSGPDIWELLPQTVTDPGLVRCRLQMLRLKPIDAQASLIPVHLCAGLTLSHYANFRNCPSLPEVKALHNEVWKEQGGYGIHVLVAQHPDGTISVGDSHEYGPGPSPYRDEKIDEAILSAMDQFLPVSNYQVHQRWDGYYNTHKSLPYWISEVDQGVWAMNLFGTGMTLSFGVTERLAEKILG